MQHSPHDIKEKLLRALDSDNNVVDMVAVCEVITVLEETKITKDELEKTRLGRYINELRKKTKDQVLSKRAKALVRKWRSDYNIVANGEHHHNSGSSLSNSSPLISHLPGPGPGHGPINRGGWGPKPASPAFLNHHHRGASGSGLTETSPGNSQCSSASVSPPVLTTTPRPVVGVGGGHSITPTSRLSATPTDGHFPGFKPISPAPNCVVTNNSFIMTNKFSRSVNITSPATTSTTSRSSPIAYKSRAHFASSKRTRPDDDDSCDRWDAHGPANSSLSPTPTRFSNGVADMGDSMDSARSFGESIDECNASRESSLAGRTTTAAISSSSGKRRRGPCKRPEKNDNLKDKLASHLKTPKVKTTAELIQELKARSSGSAATVRSSPQGSGVVAGGVNDRLRVPSTPSAVDEASLAYTRKVVYSSLLGTDEDVTRNKTELMEKFLNDSAGSDAAPSSDVRSKDIRTMMKMESLHKSLPNDPVADILATLPPINVDEIVWTDDEQKCDDQVKIESDSNEPCEVSDETIQRLHTTDWECLNGNNDHKGEFRRWNEMLTRESVPDNVLLLLPYVDIE
ncbi:Transcription elongation factor [Chamberlinius hualienensis]